ncbi:hypothetical protein [Atopomonas sediminilitoris]|uniref:hypothetical protein n=1 Tax=Atopomonas sediminilitoris TaxID=2919919 RepID=UPI001F4E7B20|nr:hypothetical protein [Atopomonas sediminilitoris]MCJ8168408.1 hypothetical protein [Atopomonas sediminilitoris]
MSHRDYAQDKSIKRLRRSVAIVLLLVAGVVLWLMLEKALSVLEQRTVTAMADSLRDSVLARSAEMLIRGESELDLGEVNPFSLLRWQPKQYCGELYGSQPPQTGCWYYLPQRRWVVYRLHSKIWQHIDTSILAFAVRPAATKVLNSSHNVPKNGTAATVYEMDSVNAQDLREYIRSLQP